MTTPFSENLDEHPDTPDSSIKEEPSEEGNEDGVTLCRWNGCGKESSDLRSLVDHINTAHMDQKKGCEGFPCFWQECPKRYKPFNSKYKLVTHIRVHTGEKPNHCKHEGCTRKFARLENLKIHVRSHTGEKPFQCKYTLIAGYVCDKKFSNSSDRAKHEQTHKDPKPYKCDVPGCYKNYTDPSSLRKHVKNHSKEEQDQYKMYRECNLAAEHLWSQQENAAASSNSDQHTFIPGMEDDGVGSLAATSMDPLPASSMQMYTHQQAFQQYRKCIARQGDSLDSVEGESSLPYDSVPIRLEQTDEIYGLPGDSFIIHRHHNS